MISKEVALAYLRKHKSITLYSQKYDENVWHIREFMIQHSKNNVYGSQWDERDGYWWANAPLIEKESTYHEMIRAVVYPYKNKFVYQLILEKECSWRAANKIPHCRFEVLHDELHIVVAKEIESLIEMQAENELLKEAEARYIRRVLKRKEKIIASFQNVAKTQGF